VSTVRREVERVDLLSVPLKKMTNPSFRDVPDLSNEERTRKTGLISSKELARSSEKGRKGKGGGKRTRRTLI